MAFILENGIPKENAVEKTVNDLASQGKTPLIFAKNGKVIGVIAVRDTVRDSSRQAIESFKKLGLRVVMLTGDNKITAEAIKNELGLEEAISDVLPTEKEALKYKKSDAGHRITFLLINIDLVEHYNSSAFLTASETCNDHLHKLNSFFKGERLLARSEPMNKLYELSFEIKI